MAWTSGVDDVCTRSLIWYIRCAGGVKNDKWPG